MNEAINEAVRNLFDQVGHYTYLALHLFIISFPLVRSFEPRINYVRKWKYLVPGILIAGVFFIGWDALFTAWGIWSFNPKYVIGVWWLGLPVEEWLFFLTVPFSCVFIYECVLYFLPNPNTWRKVSVPITWAVALALAVVALANYDRLYTSIKLGLTAMALVVHILWFKDKYLGRFWIAYLFTIIPFLLVNGVLTFMPVVSYDPAHNLGIRVKDLTGISFLNIPIEDSLYSLLLLLMNITIYEIVKSKSEQKTLVSG